MVEWKVPKVESEHFCSHLKDGKVNPSYVIRYVGRS